jgi:RNA polymerase sigma-70 factor, ECF subfamily
VHVTAVRLAIDLVAPEHAARSNVDLMELVAPEQTPEIETARNLYEERFRTALEEIFQHLPAREKTILRLHVVDGLNIDAIGAIYRVHRATAARWLVAIRTRVYDRLKKDFAIRWKASSSDLRSLVSLLRDHIHITAKRVLGSAP